MKIYKFRFTCDDYIYEVSADLQVEAETREEADKKVMRLLYEEYPIAKTNNTASIKLMEVDCISEPKEPCEYCVNECQGKNIIEDEEGSLEVYLDFGYLTAQTEVGDASGGEYTQMLGTIINYCPMCGRKLEVEG